LSKLILTVICFSALAVGDDLAKYDGKFRIAKEFELKVSRLRYLMRYFHFYTSTNSELPESVMNEYLDEPSNLDTLPEWLREQLVEGLEADLKASSLEATKPSAPLLGADGQPIDQKLLIVPGADLVSPTNRAERASPPPVREKQILSPDGNPFKYPARERAWETLRTRWRALSLEDKRRHAEANHHSSLAKATLAVVNANHMDVGPELGNMVFHTTIGGLEIKDPNTQLNFSPRRYLQELADFSKKAGITNYLADPLNHHDGEASYHVHISTVEMRNLEPLLNAMNQLYLLRFLDAGESKAMFNLEGSSFTTNLSGRGILRMIDANHFEIRTHLTSPEEELKEVLAWLSEPEEVALKKIREEIERRLSDNNIKQMVGAEHGLRVLGELRGWVSAPVKVEIEKSLRGASEELALLFARSPHAMDGVLRDLLKYGLWPDAEKKLVSLDLTATLKEWSKLFEYSIEILETHGVLGEGSLLLKKLLQPESLAAFDWLGKSTGEDALPITMFTIAGLAKGNKSGSQKFFAALLRRWAKQQYEPPKNSEDARRILSILGTLRNLGIHEVDGIVSDPFAVAWLRIPRPDAWKVLPIVWEVPQGRALADELMLSHARYLDQHTVNQIIQEYRGTSPEWLSRVKAARSDLNWQYNICGIMSYID